MQYKVKEKRDVQQVTEKFKKQELIVKSEEQYPQDLMFQVTQERCDLLNSINVGDVVEIDYNLRGREWINPQGEAKYFTSLDIWKITKVGTNTPAPQTLVADEGDGLPF